MCALPDLALSLIINFVPVFSYCLLETFLLSNRGVEGRGKAALGGLALGFLVFIQVKSEQVKVLAA